MGAWSFAAAAQTAPGTEPGGAAAGCYGNMAHQGTPSPDKCGLQDITTTPSSIAPTLGGTVQCTQVTFYRPVAPTVDVATLDDSFLPTTTTGLRNHLLATLPNPCEPRCGAVELPMPAFMTFQIASLDDRVAIPAAAWSKVQPMLIGDCGPQ